MPTEPRRDWICAEARRLISGERDTTHGRPQDNLALAAELFGSYQLAAAGRYPAAHDAAVFMICNKLSRIACGQPAVDHYVDICGYAAIAGEIVATTDEKKTPEQGAAGA